MGMLSRFCIEDAARHLLSILETHEFVDFSLFYDGTDKTEERLRKAIFPPDAGDRSLLPEVTMDYAVAQLEKQGVVKKLDLDSKPLDIPDAASFHYRIAWAEGGREKAKAGPLTFWNVDF